MDNKLIFLGDHVRFSQDVGKVANIISITKTVTSTQEDLTDLELLYSRVSINLRVSKEDNYYSDWYDLKDIELSNTLSYSNVYINPDYDTSVELEFKLLDVPNTWDEEEDFITVSFDSVETSAIPSQTVELIPNPPTISAVGNNSYVYNETFSYNPYNLGNLGNLQNDLSMMANQIWGHNIEYIKVNPLEKGNDFIYHEWNLYGATQDDIKCLKVLILNNEFQNTNGFLFNQFGVNFTDNIEAHIDHQYFQKIYGEDKIPQQYDIIYIPIVNRMYEISGTVPVKNVSQKLQYWKLTLTKYEKRSNILLDTDTKTKINEKALGLEDLFNPISDIETENIAIEKQTQYNKLENENIRNFVNTKLGITTDNIQSYFNLVSDSQYNLNSLYSKDRTLAVTYSQQFEIKQDLGASLSFVASLELIKTNSVNVTLEDHTENFKLTLSTGLFSPDTYTVNSILTLYNRSGNSKLVKGYVKVLSVSNDKTYLVVEKLNEFENGIISLMSITTRRDIILTGLNTYDRRTKIRSFVVDSLNQRFAVSILDNFAVLVEYFGEEYLFLMPQKFEYDNYYSFVVSMNSKFKTLGLYIYEFNNMNTSDLLIEFDKQSKVFVNNNKTSNGLLSLVGSPIKLTNIRVFSDPLEVDLHSNYLTKKIVSNDANIIIYDNCESVDRMNDYDYKGRME